jgi:hypothetical protein
MIKEGDIVKNYEGDIGFIEGKFIYFYNSEENDYYRWKFPHKYKLDVVGNIEDEQLLYDEIEKIQELLAIEESGNYENNIVPADIVAKIEGMI